MISIESTGKTVQKAIEEGLERLNKTIDEVDINILSSGGFLKKARVEITVIEDKPVKPAKEEKPARDEKAAQPVKEQKSVQTPVKEERPAEKAAQPIKEQRPPQPKKEQRPNMEGERVNKPNHERAEKPRQEGTDKPNQEGERAKPHHEREEKPRQERADRPNQEGERANKPHHERTERPRQERVDREQKPRQERVEKPQFDRQNQKTDERTRREESERQRPRSPITDEVAAAATQFVNDLLSKMKVEFTLENTIEDGELTVCIKCENGAIIGYRGETLDAIEYLTSLAINKCDDKYFRVNVDCNDYRSKRIETLTSLAKRMAEKAVKTGRKVVLDPMSSSSRKVIHSVLSENDRIITKSEGKEPTRRIIIIPKRFNATKNED